MPREVARRKEGAASMDINEGYFIERSGNRYVGAEFVDYSK